LSVYHIHKHTHTRTRVRLAKHLTFHAVHGNVISSICDTTHFDVFHDSVKGAMIHSMTHSWVPRLILIDVRLGVMMLHNGL